MPLYDATLPIREGMVTFPSSVKVSGVGIRLKVFVLCLYETTSKCSGVRCQRTPNPLMKLQLVRPVKKMNVQHPTFNFQLPMLVTLLLYVDKRVKSTKPSCRCYTIFARLIANRVGCAHQITLCDIQKHS